MAIRYWMQDRRLTEIILEVSRIARVRVEGRSLDEGAPETEVTQRMLCCGTLSTACLAGRADAPR